MKFQATREACFVCGSTIRSWEKPDRRSNSPSCRRDSRPDYTAEACRERVRARIGLENLSHRVSRLPLAFQTRTFEYSLRPTSDTRTFVFDFNDVPLIDTTAAKALEGFVQKLQRANTQVFIAGARTGVRRTLIAAGMRVSGPKVLYASTVEGVRARPPASAIAIPLSVDPAIGRLNRLPTKVDVVHSGNQTPRMSLAMGRSS